MSAPGPAGLLRPNDNNGPCILAACSVTTILALASVVARFWVRGKMSRCLGADDYVMLFAMLLSATGMLLIIPEVQNGAGRHIYHLKESVAILGLKINFATQPIYLWAIAMVKVSIACFLLRIAGPDTIYRRCLYGMIYFLITYTGTCFITVIIQCNPMARMWDPHVITGTCWAPHGIRAWSYSNSAVCIVTDLMFATIPIPMLWNVRIERRIKISLIAIMGLGVFAAAAAVVKMSYIRNYGKAGDFLWDSANLTIWTVTECNTGVIAGCLACLKPLFRSLFKRDNTNEQVHPALFGLSRFPPPIGGGSKNSASAPTKGPVREIRERDLEASSQEDILEYEEVDSVTKAGVASDSSRSASTEKSYGAS